MNKGKITKILKSRITVGIVCFLLGGMVLGGSPNKNTQQVVAQGNQTSQEKPKEEATQKPANKKEDILTMELGKTYTVSGANGSYNITIEGIRFTDERNSYSEKVAEQVMFLDFNYENVDNTEEVYVSDMNFKIMDDEGNILETYPVSDDNRSSKRLPIGGKSSASATYALPKSSKTVKILFYDNMFDKPNGQIIIETGL